MKPTRRYQLLHLSFVLVTSLIIAPVALADIDCEKLDKDEDG